MIDSRETLRGTCSWYVSPFIFSVSHDHFVKKFVRTAFTGICLPSVKISEMYRRRFTATVYWNVHYRFSNWMKYIGKPGGRAAREIQTDRSMGCINFNPLYTLVIWNSRARNTDGHTCLISDRIIIRTIELLKMSLNGFANNLPYNYHRLRSVLFWR